MPIYLIQDDTLGNLKLDMPHITKPSLHPVLKRIRTILVLTSDCQRFPGRESGAFGTPNERILHGISEAAMERRVSAPIQFVDRSQAEKLSDPSVWPIALREGQVDGLIVVSAYAEQIVESLGKLLPLVVIPGLEKPLKVDSVGPEHIHSMDMIVHNLYQLGHNRIGFVSLPERAPWSLERFAGYLYAVDKLGLTFRSGDVLNIYGPALSDRKLISSIVELSRDGVTAWVCVSDMLALQVYHDLTHAGFHVPGDISITGFDGIEVFQDGPQITTIEVPWSAIGQGALYALLDRINRPEIPTSHRSYNGTFLQGATVDSPKNLCM